MTRFRKYIFSAVYALFAYCTTIRLLPDSVTGMPFRQKWFDITTINTIPLFIALTYYGVARSHMLLRAYMAGQIQKEKRVNDQGQPVYPLLFLPLVENALKYIGGRFDMIIRLRATKTGLLFYIRNSLPERRLW